MTELSGAKVARRYALLLTLALLPISLPALELDFVTASAERFAKPHDIVLSPDGGRLYVADNGNDRIVVLDALSLEEVAVLAHREVSAPHDVVFDAGGRLLVADTGNHRIAIFEVEETRARLLGSLGGPIRSPEGVAVHPDGRVLATGAGSGNLVVYRDEAVVGEARGLSSPHDVEIDSRGNVWVADAANDRIVRFDDRLSIVEVLHGAPYDFKGPRYLDFDDAGRMYVADKYTHRIKVIAPGGELLLVLGAAAGKGPRAFDRPEGVEIRGKDIWFSDTYNDRIVRYKIID